jgi:hypothetical protein
LKMSLALDCMPSATRSPLDSGRHCAALVIAGTKKLVRSGDNSGAGHSAIRNEGHHPVHNNHKVTTEQRNRRVAHAEVQTASFYAIPTLALTTYKRWPFSFFAFQSSHSIILRDTSAVSKNLFLRRARSSSLHILPPCSTTECCRLLLCQTLPLQAWCPGQQRRIACWRAGSWPETETR